jgi:16S rRNA (cytidine1402-2'-O)-methyltransferase
MTDVNQKYLNLGTGTLYLVPAPLDFGCPQSVAITHALPLHTLEVASSLEYWICENAKTLRAYLKRVGEVCPLKTAIQQIQITELPHAVHKKGDHLGETRAQQLNNIQALLKPALSGQSVGLASEAGMPAVADPGSSVVRAAHALNINVVPLVGPSSLIMALAAMGLNGQSFAFVGYVPHESAALQKRLRELEGLVIKSEQTQLLIETPYRNNLLFKGLLSSLQPNTRVGVSIGLTLEQGQNKCHSVFEWRTKSFELPQNVPVVFAIGT